MDDIEDKLRKKKDKLIFVIFLILCGILGIYLWMMYDNYVLKQDLILVQQACNESLRDNYNKYYTLLNETRIVIDAHYLAVTEIEDFCYNLSIAIHKNSSDWGADYRDCLQMNYQIGKYQ